MWGTNRHSQPDADRSGDDQEVLRPIKIDHRQPSIRRPPAQMTTARVFTRVKATKPTFWKKVV
ncbi:hypothetical protein GCM10011571_34310 [Marinithermofilum abyssi]|uniref:Uncharacterized protein n=1 Tax=Marinithermofilum abyssi TaxID=1571185 RepID=A0A8J2YAI2_9BACL|nr:hypothetical protein GCM10011571_34310 [Marinithermofilum abyssi]